MENNENNVPVIEKTKLDLLLATMEPAQASMLNTVLQGNEILRYAILSYLNREVDIIPIKILAKEKTMTIPADNCRTAVKSYCRSMLAGLLKDKDKTIKLDSLTCEYHEGNFRLAWDGTISQAKKKNKVTVDLSPRKGKPEENKPEENKPEENTEETE